MIIIHAKGNQDIGIGNLSRCYSLIKFLEKKFDVIGIFECNKELFKKYQNKNIFRSNSIQSSLNIIKRYKNFIYFCDLINPPKELSMKLKTYNVHKIFHFNGLEKGFEPDVLFITDSFDYPFYENGFKLYRGFKYYIIGENIIKSRPKKYIKKNYIKNVLICFGGADPAFFTEHFAKTINDSKYNYTIILGPAMSQERKCFIKNIKKDNITYVDNPKNMTDLYSRHDLLITLGGMMTYEAMCLGLPVCGIQWSYLSYIVKNFGEKNMINDLGTIEKAYINMLNLDINTINIKSRNSYKIIDGKALINIEKVIKKYI